MKSRVWIVFDLNSVECMNLRHKNPTLEKFIPEILRSNTYFWQTASAYHRCMLVFFVKDFSESESARCKAKAFDAGFSSKNTEFQFAEVEWSSSFPPEVRIVEKVNDQIE